MIIFNHVLAISAKFFVHAFAQFRWGVFQEYAEEGEHEFYMSPSTGRPEAIRCTIMLRGLVQKNDSTHTICYLSKMFIVTIIPQKKKVSKDLLNGLFFSWKT